MEKIIPLLFVIIGFLSCVVWALFGVANEVRLMRKGKPDFDCILMVSIGTIFAIFGAFCMEFGFYHWFH
jgi:threonine/homoserine/homoserine lactone efflux protein